MSEAQPPPVHAAIYARVSTDEQGRGYSIETQVAGCHQYARQHGMVVWDSHVFIDRGISGAVMDRPALDAMRQIIRSRAIQAVIVYDIDRLARNLTHQCLLIDEQKHAGVVFHPALHPIDATPEGQMLLQVLGAFAELERAKIRERSLRGSQKRLEMGLPKGHTAPYGYRWTKSPHASTLEVDETEAEVVRQIFRWCLDGRSVRSITRQLTQDRIPTRRATLKLGTKKTPPWCWNVSSVHRMLRSTAYLGRIYAGMVKVSGKIRTKQPRAHWTELHIPAIIDQDTFDAVAVQLVKNGAMAQRKRKHDYLLSAASLRCGQCGGGLSPDERAYYYNLALQRTYVYYRCNTRQNRSDGSWCRVTVPAWQIDTAVWAFVERLLVNPDIIMEAITLAQAGGVEQRREAQHRLDSLDRRLTELTQADARLIEAYTGGALTVDELKAQRERLSQQKQQVTDERWEAQVALDQLGSPPPEPYALQDYLAAARERLQTDRLAERRMVIDWLGLVVTWTRGQPLLITGRVPSHTPGQPCVWHTSLTTDLNLTLDL